MFNLTGISSEEQTLPITDISDLDIIANQIFDHPNEFLKYIDIQSLINDFLRNEPINEFETDPFNGNQFTTIMLNANQQPSLNTFQNMSNSNNSNQFQLTSSNTLQITNSSLSTIDNAILPSCVLSEHNKNTLIPENMTINQNQSTSVVPIVYMSDSNPNLPYTTTTEIQNQPLKSTKIQVKCQPRNRFRPRTQNESKNSSHYLRCEDDAELEYPAIYVHKEWACQSNTNIIEICLVDINKQPHPYSLQNKTINNAFDDEGLIFKQNESNVLYFRLTNDDFLKGYKTFMIELIKSKQDDVITKKLIRLRQLDQSMLRFTRIYRNKDGKYVRDTNNEEYSCIMSESYGDVTVELVGPRYGPMSGQEMMFIVFKGRIVKEEISITITEPTISWTEDIEKFMINGSFIYFPMPNFPYPQLNRVNVSINIYFKQQKIHESTYLYTNLLDKELAESKSDIGASSILNIFDQLRFDMLTGKCPVSSSAQKVSKSKPKKKRLTSK